MMTGRERFLTVLSNGRPDRLPCQVHCWMEYYLANFLEGRDQYQAYEFFDMDPVIYVSPDFRYDPKDLARWVETQVDQGTDADGSHHWTVTIETPDGDLRYSAARNRFTQWVTKPLLSDERDMEIWLRHCPTPVEVDWTPVLEAKRRIGDRGIVRGAHFHFGQGGAWQSYCMLRDTEAAIFDCYDRPDMVHRMLEGLLRRMLAAIERGGPIPFDLVETGGGAGSSTVISPDMHREFCLPYDIRQHAALRAHGTKSVYHLCGGLMPLLEIVAENGADGLETMTPASMGGDCRLAEARRRVGDRLFFIGGFDQNAGFEQGDAETVETMVRALFEACPDGGYICSPSDHFFFGHPDNIRAFVRACRACAY